MYDGRRKEAVRIVSCAEGFDAFVGGKECSCCMGSAPPDLGGAVLTVDLQEGSVARTTPVMPWYRPRNSAALLTLFVPSLRKSFL